MTSDTAPTPGELAKQYRPAEHEGRVWQRWIKADAFHADPGRVLRGEAEPYCVLIPPPNVTAALHLGHAFNNTLQDMLVRAHRMRGFETLWMPGTDHAGIATQAVVEKRISKEEGKRRTDFSREEFVARVQAFKDEYEATITGQLKAMGCSCDWERQRFTMDPVCTRAVREAFFRLFKDGLIYRGKRLVNWDPALQTAVADDECYDEEVDSFFYYLRYPVVDGERAVPWHELVERGYPVTEAIEQMAAEPAWVTVATTRPETYLGDTAVAISPADPRAAALRGLRMRLPLVGRVIPIVEDTYVVLPEALARTEEEKADPKAKFATGFLKVTPAHDANDAELGQRHNLAAINMMSPDGRVSDKHGWTDVGEAGTFLGKKMAEARKMVVKEFESRGLLEATRPYRHSLKFSDRSKAVIEPYLSDQWYVQVTDPRMARAANEVLAPEQRSGAASSALPSTSRGAGLRPASSPPTSFSSSPTPITKTLHVTSRRLPHWQYGGRTYFITFRTAKGELSPSERDLVLSAAKHWDGERLELHAAVVMPDHVHLVLSPFEKAGGEYHSLSEILHSVKSFSAHQIAKQRGTPGPVWQDESYDRVIRDDEYTDTIGYVGNNAVEAGLVGEWHEYRWLWVPDETREGRARFMDRWKGKGVKRDGEEKREGGEEAGGDACPTRWGREEKKNSQQPTVTFHPARYAKTYEHWHDNIRDWCISRQLWWGHRIPVWFLTGINPSDDQLVNLDTALAEWQKQGRIWVARRDERGRIEHHPIRKHFEAIGGVGNLFVCVRNSEDIEVVEWLELNGTFSRDNDVLDTWFSSALWPLSTMGWPDQAAAGEGFEGLLEAFNPSSTLSTAREIITLWVSRMVMFNRYFLAPSAASSPPSRSRGAGVPPASSPSISSSSLGPPPFRDVFVHAIIQDGEGRKMSKSLGNGVDPLDIIATHGADAMRFTLCHMATQTQDVRLPVVKGEGGRNTSPKFDLGRNFATKLWNAARFTMGILTGSPDAGPESSKVRVQSLPDRWMLSRLASAIDDCDRALAEFEFASYAQTVYTLLWNDFCDWYLEAIKPSVAGDAGQRAVLAAAFDAILRLLHPVMPFVTEAIYEEFPKMQKPLPARGSTQEGILLSPPRRNGLLCTAGWPVADASLRDADAVARFGGVQALVSAVREVRAQHKVGFKRRTTLHMSAAERESFGDAAALIETLAASRIEATPPTGASIAINLDSREYRLSDLADAAEAVDTSAERERLERLVSDLTKSKATLEGRLANPGYALKAPPHMVQQTKDQLTKAEAELAAAVKALGDLP